MQPINAGDGYTYLTRHIATGDSTELGRQKLADYYSDKGESPGMWIGSGLRNLSGEGDEFGIAEGDEVTAEQMKALYGEGLHPNADMIMRHAAAQGATKGGQLQACRLGRPFNVHSNATPFRVEIAKRFNAYNAAAGVKWNAPIPAEDRARIRTDVSREMFAKEYGRAPLDDRELSGWTAKMSRQNTKDVAGFDCAFTPPKSVSVLWALAPMDIARVIEECHDQAVRETIAYLEERAAFARIGTGGVGQVDTNGLIAAAFRHRDSRAGDPNLHTHVVIANPVQVTMPNGRDRWLRLDSHNGMFPMNVPASEFYNTRSDQLLRARLPIDTFDRGDGVMEIAGVDLAICDDWSKRAKMIDRRTSELAREFQRQYGREPSPVESLDLRDRANQETRQGKHAPKSHAEQRAEWREFSQSRIDPDRWVADALSAPVRDFAVTDDWLAAEAVSIVEAVSGKRARWQVQHTEAEIQRRIRWAGVRDGDHGRVTEGLRERVAALAIRFEAPPLSAKGLEPDCMRRRDGRSIYHRALSDQFTSQAVLDAEDRIIAAAGLTGGVVLTDTEVDLALLEATANGAELNAGQASMVREIATSPRRLQLVLAPAGTGKTHAMKTLGKAWNQRPGHHVLGLSPTAAASAKLREEIDTDCDNLAKLKQLVENPGKNPPEWFTRIGPGTLAVVDEAGMASTQDLDVTLGYLADRGAKVLTIGDHKQLPAVAAGGVLQDIAAEYGAVTLSHVMRFTDKAEGPASLALRRGDESALGFYADQGRIHVGEPGAVEAAAYEAWARDVAGGKDSILLAYSRDTVAELNARARADRLQGRDPGMEAELADGLKASVGDTVCSRHNDRRLVLSSHDWVRNGDRWTVEHVLPDGSLWVRHQQLRRPVVLPAAYVTQHVELGYARTVHSAQGLTAGGQRQFGSCHTIFTGRESRELFYTALGRARDENHMWLSTALSGDMHDMVTDKGTLPATGLDVARAILARKGEQVSARSAMRDLADPLQRLGEVAGDYEHALGVAAEHLAGVEVMDRIDAEVGAEIQGCDGWPVLRQRLAVAAVEGRDPVDVLHAATTERELGSARDVAAVLAWRVDKPRSGPLPWLPGVPDVIRDDAVWGRFVVALAADVRTVAEQSRAASAMWTPSSAPAWARPFVVDHPALCADLAVWRAARGVEETDRRPVGRVERGVAESRAQDALRERVRKVSVDPETSAGRWRGLCEDIDPRITEDPFWLEFAANLDRLSRAGVDAEGKLRAAADKPLPDELAASALWWRMVRGLEAGAVEASGDTRAVRPKWTMDLLAVLGERDGLRVLADPAWPQLVAAVEDAHPPEVRELLETAHRMITVGHEDEPLPASELAGALAWRVEMLAADDTPVPVVEAPPVEDELPPDPMWEDAPDEVWIPPVDATPLPADDALRDMAAWLVAESAWLRAGVDREVAAVLSGRGPASAAVAPVLADLRARRDAQAPFRVAHLEADVWAVECEARATQADVDLAELTANPVSIDWDLPVPDDLRAAVDALRGPDPSWLLSMSTAELVAHDARRVADEARRDADALRDTWVQFAGGEGRLVRPDDVTVAAALADELDLERLAPMRDRADFVAAAARRAQLRVLSQDAKAAESRGLVDEAERLRRDRWRVENPVRESARMDQLRRDREARRTLSADRREQLRREQQVQRQVPGRRL